MRSKFYSVLSSNVVNNTIYDLIAFTEAAKNQMEYQKQLFNPDILSQPVAVFLFMCQLKIDELMNKDDENNDILI